MKIQKIEIDFPITVEFDVGLQMELDEIIREICDRNVPEGHVMWPASCGYKPTYIPLTAEEEKDRGIEFDESIYHIGCTTRKEN